MLILCRHGLTPWSARRTFLSVTDAPLSEEGRRQCAKLRATFEKLAVEKVFSSPACRCLQTAEIVAPSIEPELRVELREIDFGLWEGLAPEDVEAAYPGQLALRAAAPATFRPPEGESFEDVARRLRPFLADLLRVGASSTLIVSHRGTLGSLERLLRGYAIRDPRVASLREAEFHIVRSSDRAIPGPIQKLPSESSKTSCQ